MGTEFYATLSSDCALATILLVLFIYAARVGGGQPAVAAWAVGQLLFTFGASAADATAIATSEGGLAGTGGVHAGAAASAIAAGGIVTCAMAVTRLARAQPMRSADLVVPLVIVFLGAGVGLVGGSLPFTSSMQAAVELAALSWIAYELRHFEESPYLVPARAMMFGCGVLALLYAWSLWSTWAPAVPTYHPSTQWPHADVAVWFMLNFCLLMIASFRAIDAQREHAFQDPLTGALNRRGLNSALRRLRDRLDPDTDAALLILDLDHFKAINDRHGRAAGDSVLQQFAQSVSLTMRADDLFARLGGEEFVVLVPGISAQMADSLAQRLRRAVGAVELESDGRRLRITASVGMATGKLHEPFTNLLQSADAALYRAKRAGRDRVETSAATGHDTGAGGLTEAS
jgi:diguanylate cyclase (GGDEF)-like protein